MTFKTLLARTTAVVAAVGAAVGSVIALEPGMNAAGAVNPRVTTTVTNGDESVSGTVSGTNGAGVAGDAVTLVGTSGNVTPFTATTSGTSGSVGTYTITGVTPGTYYVQFAAVSAGGVNYQAQYLGGSQVAAGSQTIALASGQSITGANAALLPWNTPGTTVTVPVTVTTGTPGITLPTSTVTVTKTTTTPGKTVTVMTPAKTVTVTKTTTTTTKTTTATAPTVASGSLGGIGARNVALKFKVVAGSTALKSFEVKLPKGFSFVSTKLKAGVKLGKLNFTDKLSGGALTVTLKSAQKSFTATLGGGAITTTTAIVRNALIHKIASEKVTLAVTDAKGVKTTLPFVIAKPS